MKMFSLALGMALLAGCATATEGDKRLNHQNEMAGAYIAEKSSEPEVQQAGRDVASNAAALKANLIGAPAVPAPYSPEASAKAREQSTKEHSTPWWGEALKMLGGAILGGGLVRTLAGIAPRLVGGPVGLAAKGLDAVVEGVARIREKAAANGGTIALPQLLDELAKAQADPRVREAVRAVAHKKEAELAAKM